jgi:hypothetical protein
VNVREPCAPGGITYAKVLIPVWGQPLKVVGLCSNWFGCYTHWVDRSKYCSNNRNCALCAANLPRRWKGFLPVILSSNSAPRIVELTPRTAGQLRTHVKAGQLLRERELIFTRTKPEKNSPVAVQVSEGFSRHRFVPPAFDPSWAALYMLGHEWDEVEQLRSQMGYTWEPDGN